MVLKTYVQLSIIILLSVVLSNEISKNRAIILKTLKQINVSYNPLIKRSPRTPEDLEYYEGLQQCADLRFPSVWSLSICFLCLIAFLGWKYSWIYCFKKSKKAPGVNPSPRRVLPHLHRLHRMLSGVLEPPSNVPFPLTICPTLVPLVNLWSSRTSEQEEASVKYLQEHSEELEEVMRSVLDLMGDRKSPLVSERGGRESPGVVRGNRRGVTLTPLKKRPSPWKQSPSSARKRVNGEISLPFSQQIAAPQMKRTVEAAVPTLEEPDISSGNNYVLIPRIKKGNGGRVMNIEIEFESEKEECASE